MDPEIWTAVVNMKPGCKILVVELPQDSLYDESGVVCYTYGNMGEVTQETRIYALPFLSSPLALSTQFTYDSWGRIQDITYPDNEVVSYGYDLGGQLQSITNNNNYTYLDNVTYDRFGAKNSQAYGNGIATDYSYHSLTRRLTGISSNDGTSISYTYDPVGNVTQVASSYSWMQGQNLTETFTYDASDQLVSASETQFQSYLLDVTYGNWGKISDYDLTRTDYYTATVTQDSRSFAYPSDPSGVQEAQTMFAPESQTGTTDAQFTFGINGSLRRMETHSPEHNLEHYLFNSAANLKAYSSEAMDFAYYGYNASNARTYKLSLSGTYQWHNGQQLQLSLQPQLSMFYPNAYINFNGNGEYTKHYYSGSERIASRLGNANMDITVTANARLTSRSTQLDSRFQDDIRELMSDNSTVCPPSGISVNSLHQTGTSDIYYYHTNHLGSTAYVTDNNAIITQGFLYAPFGEITTEYNANFGNNVLPKYSFNAKELDEETGMYYYEARYYKPPVFTSRDPMMDQKLWLSPYNYCSNNPVGRTDLSGKKDRPFNRKKDKKITYEEGTATPIYNYDYFFGIPVGLASNWVNAYNCHSYAWHNSQGDPTPAIGDIYMIKGIGLKRWDNNPADDIIEQNARQLDHDENNEVGDIVIYYTDKNKNGQYDDGEYISHSAVVTTVDEEGYTIEVTGKMGQGPISTNHPDAPKYYKRSREKIFSFPKKQSRAYFRLPQSTSQE